jgi:hypothetical protein
MGLYNVFFFPVIHTGSVAGIFILLVSMPELCIFRHVFLLSYHLNSEFPPINLLPAPTSPPLSILIPEVLQQKAMFLHIPAAC